MDDLISRQEAIDALVERMGIDWDSLKIFQPALKVIEQVPSAEPQWIPVTEHSEEYNRGYRTGYDGIK